MFRTSCSQCVRVVIATCLAGALAQPSEAQQAGCGVTSVSRTPLNDLGTNLYKGFVGGFGKMWIPPILPPC